MGDFDSIKLGVTDNWWKPAGSDSEVYLGLTKGGTTLTYTPEYHDIQVDQYGKTPVDEALIGETCVVKIPLAETDLNKIKMFAHTGTWDEANKKITFGRYPGFRLGDSGGVLRIHPISFGTDQSEDVTLYKAVNKAPLELNYQLDNERIFQTEFSAMIKRSNASGSFLFEMGQPGSGSTELKPDLSNLEELFQATGADFQVNPVDIPMLYGTPDPANAKEQSLALTVSCIYNFITYDITSMVTYSIGTPIIGATNVTDGSGGTGQVIVLERDSVTNDPTGVLTAKSTEELTSLKKGSNSVAVGDVISVAVTISWAGKTHVIPIQITV